FLLSLPLLLIYFSFFLSPPPPSIYPLSLHDALPIWNRRPRPRPGPPRVHLLPRPCYRDGARRLLPRSDAAAADPRRPERVVHLGHERCQHDDRAGQLPPRRCRDHIMELEFRGRDPRLGPESRPSHVRECKRVPGQLDRRRRKRKGEPGRGPGPSRPDADAIR